MELISNGINAVIFNQIYNFPEIKSRSQSEQPASCPICGAVIKQSRNLRRHLELRHFSKPGIKKERKSEFS